MALPSQSEPKPITQCPFDHQSLPFPKTGAKPTEASPKPLVQDEAGDWHIYSFELARALLRADDTRQAGFQAERLEKLPKTMRDPVIFQEGDAHRSQRVKTARFFTPKTTDESYRQFMETFVEEVLTPLKNNKQGDLSEISMQLAVKVAAEVVGLTHSRRAGMSRRIEAFMRQPAESSSRLAQLMGYLSNQWQLANFFFTDIQPAITVRCQQPRENVISHTLAEGYSPLEILTECVTYAAAGMVTTREFISVAAWHLLEHDGLKAYYLAAPQEKRYKLLHELLRLEPVVGALIRKVEQDITLSSDCAQMTIPAGSRVTIHTRDVNMDSAVVGSDPERACPIRPLPRSVPDAVMSFGDGHHRCPGAYIAIQESDIFLTRLLAIEGLHIVHPPEVSWNELVKGYELRNFIVALK